MRLPPIPASLRLLLRVGLWLATTAYFAFGLAVLVLRYHVLPGIEAYRADIEQAMAAKLGRPVAIRTIEAHWHGLRPVLAIGGLEIQDAEGRPALALEHVDADLSWGSLWRLEPRFARLEIDGPRLDLRRDALGRLFIAGLELPKDEDDRGGFSAWLLAQPRIVVRDATLVWHDEFRDAPPLVLAHVNIDMQNRGLHHRFGITAEPPRELAARLDLRADLEGRTPEALASWTGEAYAELDYADLAAWRAWIDYPLELPRGHGGLRVWLTLAKREVTGITADLRLVDTAVRLREDLPMLELKHLDGRLKAQLAAGAFLFQARKLGLETTDGIRIPPADIDVRWQAGSGKKPERGEAGADGLDVGSLAAVAAYLPFDAEIRREVAAYGPGGVVRGLRFTWTGDLAAPEAFSLKADFEDLGLNAIGIIPGFEGLDGRIEADQAGGMLQLNTRGAVLDLPAVFEHSRIALAQLDAAIDWSVGAQGLDVRLRSARFRNPDAAGEGRGSWRRRGDSGPGEIDLTARLTRATGDAVWRYLPLVVNRETRDWLKSAIVGGSATATLRLKGDLDRFPFADGSGIFEVKGPFEGARLAYAPGWPAFDDVSGTLEFVRERMTIRASKGGLWGIRLADVKAEIADLGAAEERMIITGTARGPTPDFLHFIEASPVGGHIDHFTSGLAATGNGELALHLDMPLRHIADTRIEGRYRMAANTLTFDPQLPALADVQGELRFTGSSLEGRRLRATFLGEPLSVDIASEDGGFVARGAGSLSVATLRRLHEHPLLDHLTGATAWNGSLRVRKGATEVRIESTLEGLASGLPAPFEKSAGEAMAFFCERLPEPEGKEERIRIGIGETARAEFVRRPEDGRMVVTRGLVAIVRPDARLPAQGVRLAAQAGRLDADFWRRLGERAAADAGAPLAVSEVDLRADELKAFGRTIHDLVLAGTLDRGTWKMTLKSREASGRIEWTGEGAGRLSARLVRLDLPEGEEEPVTETASAKELPAIDLAVDRFLLHGREIGELRAEAENADGLWRIRFTARNEDGELTGNGQWRPAKSGSAPASRFEFHLSARSLEGLLRQWGYPGMVRRGRGTLDGTLAWAGPPTALDYKTLDGQLHLNAESGQFNKLEPGVGRLLGVLSLQMLPRRITLDFRDVFSEGFAFDRIRGEVAVERGIMRTEDLSIEGPAATVLMNGKVDLAAETQDLKVRIQPALGEMLATSVLLINPAMGAAAWVMNRVFGRPLDKVFAFDYTVTGPWEDPKVEKVAVQAPIGPLETGR